MLSVVCFLIRDQGLGGVETDLRGRRIAPTEAVQMAGVVQRH